MKAESRGGAGDTEVAMPLGKYRGCPLGEIPTGYLDWLIGQDWMLRPRRRSLLLAINDELQGRPEYLDGDYDADEDELI